MCVSMLSHKTQRLFMDVFAVLMYYFFINLIPFKIHFFLDHINTIIQPKRGLRDECETSGGLADVC